jgi:bacterioferritin-associated ferredoxin
MEDKLRLNLNFIPADLLPSEFVPMDFSAACHEPHGPRPVCHCLGVPAEEIRSTIAEQDLNTVRGVTKACGAGGGCTSCHRHIKRMLAEHAAQRRMSAPAELSVEAVLGCA